MMGVVRWTRGVEVGHIRRYSFKNWSSDMHEIFREACDHIGVRWTSAPQVKYVSRKADVVRLDEFIGPKA
jgi:hypothetical protein